MVRPESLRLGGQENRFSAEVVSDVYLGEVEQFVLAAGDLELRAAVGNPGAHAPRAGEAVTVGFSPDDAFLLPHEPGGPSA